MSDPVHIVKEAGDIFYKIYVNGSFCGLADTQSEASKIATAVTIGFYEGQTKVLKDQIAQAEAKAES